MNKQEAIAAMVEGVIITHEAFTPDESMTLVGGNVVFEDGCSCSLESFFQYRTDPIWNDGWSVSN